MTTHDLIRYQPNLKAEFQIIWINLLQASKNETVLYTTYFDLCYVLLP